MLCAQKTDCGPFVLRKRPHGTRQTVVVPALGLEVPWDTDLARLVARHILEARDALTLVSADLPALERVVGAVARVA